MFVGPAIGLLHAAVHEAPEAALHPGVRRGYDLGLAAASRAYPEMKKRGIRVVIGGDYGFARTPQGENARDIEHFVRHLGYSPSEALVCATRYGAELMGLGDQARQVREGFLADLLLVDGWSRSSREARSTSWIAQRSSGARRAQQSDEWLG